MMFRCYKAAAEKETEEGGRKGERERELIIETIELEFPWS